MIFLHFNIMLREIKNKQTILDTVNKITQILEEKKKYKNQSLRGISYQGYSEELFELIKTEFC